MTHEEIFERLARIDPLPHDVSLDPATSRRADELKGLIMSTEPQEKAAVSGGPRRIRRWVATGAVAVGVAAVVVVVASPWSGDGAEPIVFSAAQSSLSGRNAPSAAESTADAALAPNGKMAAAPYEVNYEVEGDLPAFDGKAQSWKSTEDPTNKQMTAVAKALGVEGDLVERKKEEGGGYVVGPTDGSAPSVSFSDTENDPFHGWFYSAAWEASSRSADNSASVDSDAETKDAVAPDAMQAPENLPTKDEAREKALSIMDAAGVDVRDDDVEVYADEWSVSVTAWQRVGDLRAPMSWTFGFGENGVISWAGGNLLTFEKGPKFPRVGTQVGVERLGDPKFSGWFGYGPVSRGVAEPAVAVDDMGAATSQDSTSDSAVAPDSVEPVVQTIIITGAKESLTPIIDADNVLWLVPSYEYTVKDGYTVSVLAITDEFIEQAAPTVDTALGGEVIEPVPATDGGGVSGSSEGSMGSAVDEPALSQEEAVQLVGLTEDEAAKVAESLGWIIRVSSRDGEDFQLTMDYVGNRVNLAIVDGKVTGVSVG
jgi:hypothetical protein